MKAERGAAVAQPRREALGDQRRLRPIRHVVRDERQDDREEDHRGNGGVQQREINEAENPDRRDADGQIRCAYHHWRFDAAGNCVDIPTGDKIPPGAAIFSYPTAEAWGLIWAFNGETPLFGVPRIPGVEQDDLAFAARLRGISQVPPWVSTSNGVDFQHLRSLHNLPTSAPEVIEVRDYAIEYRVEAMGFMQHGLITGTNVFAQHLRRRGMDAFMLFAGAPIDQHRSRGFNVVAVQKRGDGNSERQVVDAELRELCDFVDKLLAEDEAVLNTMRFRKGVLVASDHHLALYFKYVSEFPRGAPPAE
jgi:hypothetical protein